MKKILPAAILFLAVVLIFGVFTAPAYAEKAQFKLKYDQWLPATHWYHGLAEQFKKEVELRTNGRVSIRIYPGGTFGSPKEGLERVEKGLIDIHGLVCAYTPGRLDLNTIVELPFAFPDIGTAYDIGNEIFNVSPYLKKEFETGTKARVLWINHAGMQDIATRGKAIRKTEDFNGMKLRSPGGLVGKTLEALGAIPVPKPSSACYMLMQRKVVDGAIQYTASMTGYKLEEVTDYMTIVSVSVSSVLFIINNKVWESFPDDIKQVITDVSARCSQYAALKYQQLYDKGVEDLTKAGVEIIKLPPSEIEKLRKKSMPVWTNWVEKMEKKGLPGQETMDLFKKLLKKRGIVIN